MKLQKLSVSEIIALVENSTLNAQNSTSHSKKAKITRNAQLVKMLSVLDKNATMLVEIANDVNAGYLVEDIINIITKSLEHTEHSCNDSKPDLVIESDNEYLKKGTYEIKYASDYSKSGKLNLKNDYSVILVSPSDIRLVKPNELNLEKDGRINYKKNLGLGVRLEKLYQLLF